MDKHGFDQPDRIYFLFDFISHNAWLAWQRAREIAARHGLGFEPVPVVFGVMLKHYGQVGPAEVPAKSRWMLHNVLRKAQRLGLPIAPPHSHPFNPLTALRLCCCELDPAERLRLIDALWLATWVQSREVSSPQVLAELLAAQGFDAAALLAEADAPAARERLRGYTDGALQIGAFGVPTLLVRGELFWGFDDLDGLDAFLGGRAEPIAAATLSAWQAVRPSVQRKR